MGSQGDDARHAAGMDARHRHGGSGGMVFLALAHDQAGIGSRLIGTAWSAVRPVATRRGRPALPGSGHAAFFGARDSGDNDGDRHPGRDQAVLSRARAPSEAHVFFSATRNSASVFDFTSSSVTPSARSI